MVTHNGTRYYTLADLGRALQISDSTTWSRVYVQETLPKPGARVRRNRRLHYTEHEFTEIVAEHGPEEAVGVEGC